ncbi:DUF4174 domain-containing protein [Yangia mangrovi]|uniref:DUF4174 domain-containing protein n=1 Tax=Alloyangia mangrovi TaxID=1779329 RepID=A0A2A3JXV4_9RHOB|nr:DUF4174 domain-containing protein [Alloyangia mangrovi]MCA0941063.1 DUF4174 domain-containing protein [Alloyangia pacifica]MCA0944403.1 DUF4174 domain-containing protein [Alloyangia pacifica]MCT4371780.1 DUF4174 domain-containing protein [Alloyangia mangrovi]
MLRRPIPLTSFGLAAVASFATPVFAAGEQDIFRPLPAEQRDLGELRWSARPVLLFAPAAGDDSYERQMALFRDAEEELRARDIVVLSDLEPRNPGPIRQAFSPGGFKLVLVGKDGGVKLEEDTVLAPAQLFAVIDQMPMRQREMMD